MFEILALGGGVTRPVIPNSGPGGNVVLTGDETLGFMGELTDAELFTPSQLLGASDGLMPSATNPLLTPGAVHWLKFIWKGKILYIAKQQFFSGLSWNDVYNAGMMYGTRDNGKYPVGAGVWQYRPMTKVVGNKTWTLIPRTIKAYSEDPISAAKQGDASGEFNQLLGRCHVNDPNAGATTPRLAQYTYPQLGWASSPDSIAQETTTPTTTNYIIRGDGLTGTVFGSYRSVAKNTKTDPRQYWRPVLELVPSNAIKDPIQIRAVTPGDVAGIIADVRNALLESSARRPLYGRQANWPYQFMSVSYSFVDQAKRAIAVKGTADAPELRGFTITGSYTA